MALKPIDLKLLREINDAGGKLHVVTRRGRDTDKQAVGLLMWAYRMCDEDCMRVTRSGGDNNRPGGEKYVDLMLTKKGERAATRG